MAKCNVQIDREHGNAMTYPCILCLIAKIVESADTVLGVDKVEVHDKTKSTTEFSRYVRLYCFMSYPLQSPVVCSIIDLHLSMSPNRCPYARIMSSVVFGGNPRM